MTSMITARLRARLMIPIQGNFAHSWRFLHLADLKLRCQQRGKQAMNPRKGLVPDKILKQLLRKIGVKDDDLER